MDDLRPIDVPRSRARVASGSRGAPEGVPSRPAAADAETEAGLIYARGKFVHTLGDIAVLVTAPGTTAPNRPGSKIISPLVHEFRWAPLPSRGNDLGQQEYTRHVEGQPVYPPLESAARFLTGLP